MSSQAAAAGAPARRNTAALVWHQVRYEQLSFWRNPQSAFFIFAFPLVFFFKKPPRSDAADHALVE